MDNFIQYLYNRKTSFPAPEEARDKAKACDFLSKDIYKDSTRFVYELLQNADDASASSGSLYFRMDFIGEYLVVSHKGKPFAENDVESICSIGDGMKSNDSEQTGFKGIGFKSVFAHSDMVIIRSGSFCFKFDKEECSQWDSNWGSQEDWIKMRENKGKETDFRLPWQIIPITTNIPAEIADLSVFHDNSITVSTIIKCKKVGNLRGSVETLFSKEQLLLFLRSSNVTITVNGNHELVIEKRTTGDVTEILGNGKVLNTWLIKTTPSIVVPQYVRTAIEEDKEHYPEKLRGAQNASMSFAIKLEQNSLKCLDSCYNNVFAFLPTSVSKYQFPFIVNANFITDAGRQDLHQDYIWNQWLFEEMPKMFISWMSEIAIQGKYGLDYLRLIQKSAGGSDELSSSYTKGMTKALEEIPLLKIEENRMIKLKEAILDLTDINSYVTKKVLVSYINSVNGAYLAKNILPKTFSSFQRKLKELDVFTFEESSLADFFKSDMFKQMHSVSDNASLIEFLCEHYPIGKNDEISNAALWLKEVPFVFNNHENLSLPTSLCFPNSNFDSEISDDLDYLNDIVFNFLSPNCVEWLKTLGVSEPTNLSLIETRKILEDDFITPDNAVEILGYVFNLHEEGELSYRHYDILKSVPLLTQQGTLIAASNCYLSDTYKPNLTIENFVDVDFFVSSKYATYNGNAAKWNIFFEKIGVKQDLNNTYIRVNSNDVDNTNLAYSRFVKEAIRIAGLYSWITYEGWDDSNKGYSFYVSSVGFYGIPYLSYAQNYNFAKMLWSKIIASEDAKILSQRSLTANGATGFYSRSLEESLIRAKGLETCYTKWALSNHQIIPGTDGRCHYGNEVFSNSIPNAKEIAGKYLPVIDLDFPIEREWSSALCLKQDFELDDLLYILSQISKDNLNEEKTRIMLLYETIAAKCVTNSQKELISSWATTHELLSTSGDFRPISDLCYITLDGFNARNQIYVRFQGNKESLLRLFSLLGIKIITEENVKPNFKDVKPNSDISTRLLSTLPALAVLARDCNERVPYEKCKESLQHKIEDTKFYQCESIALTYDESDDTISKTTFAQDGKFYFTGELRPSKMEPMLHPLCSYLGLKGKERELFVIMTEPDFSGIVEYLEDKEYDVTDILNEMLPATTDGGSVASIGGQVGGGIASQYQIAENNEAKTLVLAKLQENGFDISDADASWSVIKGVKKDGVSYPLVVKSCKNWEHKLFLNPDEWKQLFRPNSMLWLHLGNQVVAPVKAHELFTYQDKLTLTFDTVNLLMDERINKIMEVMRYFNNVHLDVASLNPDQHRAEHLEEYLFDANNVANSDLTPADID